MNTYQQMQDENLKQLLLETYLEVEQEQEADLSIPRSDSHSLGRFRRMFELLGAIHLGLLIACLTIFIEFVILRLILHLDI